jgi:hemolysin D
VKDIVIHTVGTVVSPGTVLLSIVPENELLVAEIMIKNNDVGFVYPHQKVKVKLAAYPFAEYGMLDGEVTRIQADSDTQSQTRDQSQSKERQQAQSSVYKAIVSLSSQILESQGKQLKLMPGMQVVAEIKQGDRTVLQYILSPVKKTLDESGRER